MSKKPNLASLRTPPAPVVAESPPPAPPASVEDKPWKRNAQPSTVWFDERQMVILKQMAYLNKTSVRDLLFEAINLLLVERNELPIKRDS